jgi:hypothetical protein
MRTYQGGVMDETLAERWARRKWREAEERRRRRGAQPIRAGQGRLTKLNAFSRSVRCGPRRDRGDRCLRCRPRSLGATGHMQGYALSSSTSLYLALGTILCSLFPTSTRL